jgi:hypothetical protein
MNFGMSNRRFSAFRRATGELPAKKIKPSGKVLAGNSDYVI